MVRMELGSAQVEVVEVGGVELARTFRLAASLITYVECNACCEHTKLYRLKQCL